MAFIIKFSDDDDLYANVDIKVGPGSGRWDDIVLVKALLNLVYSPNRKTHKSPLRAPLTVNHAFDNATAILIKHFQRTFQNKVRVDGVVSRTYESLMAKAAKYTIIHLQLEAERVLVMLHKPENVLDYLRSNYPELAGVLAEHAPHEVVNNNLGTHEIVRNP